MTTPPAISRSRAASQNRIVLVKFTVSSVQPFAIGLELRLSPEGRSRDDNDVETAEHARRLVQCARRSRGVLQIAQRQRRRATRRVHSDRRALQSSTASRPSRQMRSPRAAIRRASARPIPLVPPSTTTRAAYHPNNRTDCALRMRPSDPIRAGRRGSASVVVPWRGNRRRGSSASFAR